MFRSTPSKLASSSPSPDSHHGAPQCSSSTYRTPPATSAAPPPPTLPEAVDPTAAENLFSSSLSSPSERSALMRFMVIRKLPAAARKGRVERVWLQPASEQTVTLSTLSSSAMSAGGQICHRTKNHRCTRKSVCGNTPFVDV